MAHGSYKLSAKLVRHVRQDSRNQTAIAFPYGLSQSQLSTLINGGVFSERLRARVELLGASYGLEPAACVVRVRS
jgi:hypothetical protein